MAEKINEKELDKVAGGKKVRDIQKMKEVLDAQLAEGLISCKICGVKAPNNLERTGSYSSSGIFLKCNSCGKVEEY